MSNITSGPKQRQGHPRGSSVFISHESNDRGLAQQIRAHLEAGGFECWMAPDDISGPTPWPEQIAQAIANAGVLLVIVSAHANASPHVSREVDLALESGKPLLPVRVEDIAPTGALNYLLRLAQWVDVFPGSIDDHAGPLTAMVTAMLDPQPTGTEAAPDATTTPTVPSTTEPAWTTAAVPPATMQPVTRDAVPEQLAGTTQPRTKAIAIAAAALIALLVAIVLLTRGPDSANDQIANADATGDPASTAVAATAVAATAAPEVPATEVADTPTAVAADEAVPTATVVAAAEPGTAEQTGPLTTGPFTLVSVATDGRLANADSGNPAMSADGRFVAFDSFASNLVDGDSGEFQDVFVHDRETGETTRVSQTDGQEADGDSREPWLSADGRHVLFVSTATNLDLETQDTNGTTDVFLHDRQTGITRLVSRAPDGSQHSQHSIEAHMSDDATLIAYGTYREGRLPDSGEPVSAFFNNWVYDDTSEATIRLAEFTFSSPHTGVCTRYGPRVSSDGTLATADCASVGAYAFERATGSVTPLLPERLGQTMTPARGGDIIYLSWDNAVNPVPGNLPVWHLFTYERSSDAYEQFTEIEAGWTLDVMSISSSGSHLSVVVAYESNSANDILVIDTATGSTLSFKDRFGIVPSLGPEEHGGARLSGDAALAAFSYHLDDLVEADANGQIDVFVVELAE